jgi:hypothetical protein
MEVERREYRHGFTVPDLDEVKLVLARAVVGRANWRSVSLKDDKVILAELKSQAERREVLQVHIDEVITAMELALGNGNYWFQSYESPHNWMPVVRRVGELYHVSTTSYVWAMDHFAHNYGQQQSLTMLRLEVQFPRPAAPQAGELMELDLRPVVSALSDTRLAQFTAAQLATTICRGFRYPGELQPHTGGKVLMFLDSLASVLLDVSDDTVESFSSWRQKEGEPWIILVPLALDTSTYEKEVAGAIYAPALRFIVTGSVDPEVLEPTAFFGSGGNVGLPIVAGEHETYVLTLAADLERRLRAINL